MVPCRTFTIGFWFVRIAVLTLSLPRANSSFITRRTSGTSRSGAERARQSARTILLNEACHLDGLKHRPSAPNAGVRPLFRSGPPRGVRCFAGNASRVARQPERPRANSPLVLSSGTFRLQVRSREFRLLCMFTSGVNEGCLFQRAVEIHSLYPWI
jgi:hypothetical protein